MLKLYHIERRENTMNKQVNIVTKFPKGFFTNIKPCVTPRSKNPKKIDKPFEWSHNVLNGTSKVKLTTLKSTKN